MTTQRDLFDFGLAEPLAQPPAAERQAIEARHQPTVVEPLTVEDAPTFERAMSGKRAANQRDMILDLLRQGSVTNFELADICIRYSARIHELRKSGHNIETVTKIPGKDKNPALVVYRLKEGM